MVAAAVCVHLVCVRGDDDADVVFDDWTPALGARCAVVVTRRDALSCKLMRAPCKLAVMVSYMAVMCAFDLPARRGMLLFRRE